MVIFFLAGTSGNSVDFSNLGVVFLDRLYSPNDCSSKKTYESIELKKLFMIIFEEMKTTS